MSVTGVLNEYSYKKTHTTLSIFNTTYFKVHYTHTKTKGLLCLFLFLPLFFSSFVFVSKNPFCTPQNPFIFIKLHHSVLRCANSNEFFTVSIQFVFI